MSLESVAFRANLARLVSPLRRMRARVPFYQLAAHRIPTLWSLYRGLLKEAPTDNIKFRVKVLFRKNQHLTGTDATRKHLLKGYKWLDIFTKANHGDEKYQAVLTRYSRAIESKREKEYWKQLARDEITWQNKLRNRPILTGGYLRASFYNKPLPRMKPQPPSIHRMFASRRRARTSRMVMQERVNESLADLRREHEFEMGLSKLSKSFQGIYTGKNWQDWNTPLKVTRNLIQEGFDRDLERASTQYTPEMIETVVQARRERIKNKTRELERQRRGEILKSTIRRRNQGPPAHVLSKMSKNDRRLDKISRHISEVGYVAQVKRKLGFRLKNPDAWKKEIGSLQDKERLDALAAEVRTENERRRSMFEQKEKNAVISPSRAS